MYELEWHVLSFTISSIIKLLRIHMAEVVDLYHFLFSNFEHLNYVFKTGEQKVIQDNDSCHIYLHLKILLPSHNSTPTTKNEFTTYQLRALFTFFLILSYNSPFLLIWSHWSEFGMTGVHKIGPLNRSRPLFWAYFLSFTSQKQQITCHSFLFYFSLVFNYIMPTFFLHNLQPFSFNTCHSS